MNLEKSLQKLFSLHQFGVKLGLENPKKLFEYIGNPQKSLKCIHIAGSNAKGSVASFISSMLLEDGYRVGLYTSPHFVKFNERIRVNGEMISDEFVLKFMNEINDYIDENEPTFFELTTAMAFRYFAEQNVDYAVIETGLGGRLDATNVIDPLVSVITTISLEHTNILGESLEKIAFEKGEIIKQNRKAVIGYLPDSAKKVIVKKCTSVSAELFDIAENSKLTEDFISLEYESESFNIYKTPLGGKYQRKNAALALLTILSTVKLSKIDSLFKGIDNVVKNSGIQGRYEVFNDHPKIIFDSSHNIEGVENFVNEFRNEKENFDHREIIFGVMKDKDIAGMLSIFRINFDKIYATTFDYERAASISKIIEIGQSIGTKVEGLEEASDYISNFSDKSSNSCLVVLGSIYLLGDIKSKIIIKQT